MGMVDSITQNPLDGARIISYGEIIFDQIAGKSYLGGAPLNFAWYVNQMGAEVTLVSRLGRDTRGDQAFNTIMTSGIDPCFCLLYTSPSPRDRQKSRMPSSA